MRTPPPIQVCTFPDHPARRHGHYGPGYWCSDFGSPLLSEDNGGRVQNGWILIFEKPTAEPSITCPKCTMTSHHPEDIKQGYCGNCHEFTSPPFGKRDI